MSERPPLVSWAQRAQQPYWFCTTAGLAETAASGLLPAFNGSAGGCTRAAVESDPTAVYRLRHDFLVLRAV